MIVASPRPHPAVLAAALEAGVDRVFQIGGAHAIAAMAYGTQTVPRVDKIVGPGNRWVSAAKALVTGDCAIDFYAGPTEILIVAERGPAAWIAADLIAQAEHDPDARAVLITPSRRLARQRGRRCGAPAAGRRARPRRRCSGTAASSSRETIARSDGARQRGGARASGGRTRRRWPRSVRCAGAVFVGPWTAQVAGDYAIGSNHVLPTAGAARFRGGLNAADFVRLVSVQRVTRARPRATGADRDDAGARRGPRRPRALDRESELP